MRRYAVLYLTELQPLVKDLAGLAGFEPATSVANVVTSAFVTESRIFQS